MTNISPAEVARLGQMSRINLSDEEQARFAADLSQVASVVSAIKQAPSADLPPTYYATTLVNVMREDVVGPVLDRDEVLAAAPEAEAGMFEVPQILEED